MVIARDRADAVDRAAYARSLFAAELVVVQIEVMDDLADRRQRGVAKAHPLDEHLERATVADVRELGLEHVEAELAWLGQVPLRRHELHLCVGIDEATDEPRTRDPIDVHAGARD